jgi:hypothetical protein
MCAKAGKCDTNVRQGPHSDAVGVKSLDRMHPILEATPPGATPLLVLCLTAAACGGAAPPAADEPEGMKVTHHQRGSGGTVEGGGEQMQVEGTIGGLNRAAVQKTFNEAMPTMKGCITKGRQQLPSLGGDIDVYLEIDPRGQAQTVLLTKTTLGDHRVEACVVKALESKQWPRPVGGKLGTTSSSFSFRAAHADPPKDWTAQQLEAAMTADMEEPETEDEAPGPPPFGELLTKLTQCRKDAGTGPLDVTLYLDEDGMPQSFGVSLADAQGRRALDCLGTVIQTTSFPSPGDSFAKVTVPVR